jgi:hypothetical protein
MTRVTSVGTEVGVGRSVRIEQFLQAPAAVLKVEFFQ